MQRNNYKPYRKWKKTKMVHYIIKWGAEEQNHEIYRKHSWKEEVSSSFIIILNVDRVNSSIKSERLAE